MLDHSHSTCYKAITQNRRQSKSHAFMLDTMVISEERKQDAEELLSDHNLSRRSPGVQFMVFITLIISPIPSTPNQQIPIPSPPGPNLSPSLIPSIIPYLHPIPNLSLHLNIRRRSPLENIRPTLLLRPHLLIMRLRVRLQLLQIGIHELLSTVGALCATRCISPFLLAH
jgi:hypothetical protein